MVLPRVLDPWSSQGFLGSAPLLRSTVKQHAQTRVADTCYPASGSGGKLQTHKPNNQTTRFKANEGTQSQEGKRGETPRILLYDFPTLERKHSSALKKDQGGSKTPSHEPQDVHGGAQRCPRWAQGGPRGALMCSRGAPRGASGSGRECIF